MRVCADPAALQATVLGYRARGLRVGFVPTMGFLHAGHVALMHRAAAENDVVVVSIFVNPKQFGPNEDLARYPRDADGDLAHCRGAGVDIVFMPEPAAMYPAGFQTTVSLSATTQGFCGAARPGHFDGVATVVLKLLLLAQPHAAYFGEKDFQQLAVIRAMVHDLCVPVAVVGVATVREADGLALSSRNVYLSAEERRQALVLTRALDRMRAAVEAGERSSEALIAFGRAVIAEAPIARIDYVAVADALTLQTAAVIAAPTQALLAAFFGKTRLIDNARIL